MKCVQCGSKMIEIKDSIYPYVSCGLSKIFLKGVMHHQCTNNTCADELVSIPNLEELHEQLAIQLAGQNQVLRPEEIRFLRTHLGFSGVDFSKVMGVSSETVSRWEKGAVNMKEASERLLRVLILSKVGPFRNYEHLKQFATKESKAPIKRVFERGGSHWNVAKSA